jgi:hypothetical protein
MSEFCIKYAFCWIMLPVVLLRKTLNEEMIMVSFVPVSFTVPKLDFALGVLATNVGTTVGSAAGSAIGTSVGAAVGSAVGTLVAGPVGTVVGGMVGGFVTHYIGESISENVTDTAYAYCFFIANNTSSTIPIDVSAIFKSQNSQCTGNINIAPQTSQQVFFAIKEETLNFGAIPLLIIDGNPVYFSFSSGVTAKVNEQYVNIINNPGIDITVNQSYQNTATVGDYTIGVGGNGGPLISTNIWVIINNS